MDKPISEAQMSYILRMLRELGYDKEEYELETLSMYEASKLITELKNELE